MMAKENLLGIVCVMVTVLLAIFALVFTYLIVKRKFERRITRLLDYYDNLTIQNEFLQTLVDEFIVPKLIIMQKELIKEGVYRLTLKNKGGALFNLTYTRMLNSNIVLNMGDIIHLDPEQTIKVELFIKKDIIDEFIIIRYNDKLKRSFTQKIIFKDFIIFMEPLQIEKHSPSTDSFGSIGPKLAWKRQVVNR